MLKKATEMGAKVLKIRPNPYLLKQMGRMFALWLEGKKMEAEKLEPEWESN